MGCISGVPEKHSNLTESQYIRRVQSWQFDERDVAKENMFKQRIAKKYNLQIIQVQIYISEYLKFICLLILRKDVSPSQKVDIIWHEHICYTQNYFKMCLQLYGSYLYHRSNYSLSNAVKNKEQYLNTIRRYKQLFGNPSKQIWPYQQSELQPQCGGCGCG